MDPKWKAIREDGSDFSGEEHPAMVALKKGREIKDVVMGVYNPGREETVWVVIHAIPLFRPNEKKPYMVYSTFEDITEKRKTREELLREKTFTTALIDNFPGTFLVFDEPGSVHPVEQNAGGHFRILERVRSWMWRRSVSFPRNIGGC